MIDNINMTIQQWDYVLAVIEYGNFTRAAEACFVTQPTLSIQISKLEDELGMKLLNRISSPVSGAPGAEEIIRRSRSALRLIQSIPGIAEDLQGDLSGTLSVGVIPTLSQYLLPLFLSQFLAEYPGLHLQISEKPSSDIIADIKDFRLDCGILALPVGKEGLVEERLFDEEFMVYMPPGRKREESVSLARLDLNDILLLTEGHCLRDQILDICGSPEKRQDLRLEFETGSLESLKKLVDQGLGFTLLPELSTAGLDEEQKARVIPLSPVPPMRQIGLVFHPACSRPGLVRKLAAALVKELPEKVRQNKTGFPVPWKKL
jgi:LysR family transcriptional regulator, hydrogen peroxide-inducible genes activator